MALLSALETEIAIPVCAVVGIAYSYSLARWFLKSRDSDYLDDEERCLYADRMMCDLITGEISGGDFLSEVMSFCCSWGDSFLGFVTAARALRDVSEYRSIIFTQVDLFSRRWLLGGVLTVAKAFLLTEYQYGGVFMVAFAILIFLCLGSVESFSTQSRPCRFNPSNVCKPALATAVFSAVSFLLGAFTSVLSGFLGMQIAISANATTALEESKGVGKGFFSAFRTGAVLGFLLAASGLLVLYIAINLLKLYYGNDWEGLFEAIAGYGLGGSFMALFGRAAGGIYAKAADVCVHLLEETQPEPDFHRRDPDVIAYFVGDIVGDIAGTGSDLFGSYAESSCAALVVASISSFGNDHDFTAMCYPLLISSMGILVCLMTTLFTANFSKIKEVKEINPAVRKQLIISTILMTFGIVIVSWIALPPSFTVYNFGLLKVVKNWQLCFCAGVGLWAGLVTVLFAKLYTNDDVSSFQDFATAIVVFGLAFVKIPIFAAISILLSYRIASMYGIAVAAVGMLSTIATQLAIGAHSPISDNAKRIAKVVYFDRRTLNGRLPLSNNRAAILKGFIIESASLVSIALFGAFVSRAAISPVDIPTPKVFMGLIVGTMLPNWFSAMTMKRVGPVALKMVKADLRLHQLRMHCRLYRSPYMSGCLEISTDASFRGMIRPAALVMLTPLIVGTFFGVEMLSGVLAGSIGSVVQIAISASNTGGAWEKARKYIRAGASEYAKTEYAKTHYPKEIHRAVDKGDTIGNPLKDTSGPPLNILIQLMVVESLVFAPFFTSHGGLLFKMF